MLILLFFAGMPARHLDVVTHRVTLKKRLDPVSFRFGIKCNVEFKFIIPLELRGPLLCLHSVFSPESLGSSRFRRMKTFKKAWLDALSRQWDTRLCTKPK